MCLDRKRSPRLDESALSAGEGFTGEGGINESVAIEPLLESVAEEVVIHAGDQTEINQEAIRSSSS